MISNNLQSAYNKLSGYFGLRSVDDYLNAVGLAPPVVGGGEQPDVSARFLVEIFGDTQRAMDSQEIAQIFLTSDNFENLKNTVCVTAMNDSKADTSSAKELRNYQLPEPAEQGWCKEKEKEFFISDFYSDAKEKTGNVSVYQIFPAERALDTVDTDVVSLFMNSLTTFEMSRAVPYLDVKIIGLSTRDEEQFFKEHPDFSLGKFLGFKEDKVLLGRFEGDITSARANAEKLAVVAGLEVFTSPQTMVNAENVSYDRRVGGRIDAFRPFMSLMGIKVSDIHQSAATISYKTADLTVKLHDKGRLRDIAPFVTPRRDGNVRFEITYGWSHPDGTTIGRAADASSGRIGSLIDAMKVSENYVLTNSSYTFTDDGGVDINLKLAMDSTHQIFNADVSSISLSTIDIGGNSIDISALASQLETISDAFKKETATAEGNMRLPMFLSSPSVDSLLSLDAESYKKLRDIATKLVGKRNPLAQAAKDLLEIIGKSASNGKKGPAGGKVSTIIAQRKGQAAKLVSELESTPDPFLRPTVSYGVGADKLSKLGAQKFENLDAGKKQRQRYVSYGKLVTSILASAIQTTDNEELHLVFSSFNQDAAGMFDHNISQFPISLDLLRKDLEEEFEKRHKFNIEQFLRFVNEKYIQFTGSSAYGFDMLYESDQRDKDGQNINGKFTAAAKKANDNEDDISISELQRKNLEAIYGPGKRAMPTFTLPKVTARIVVRNNPNGKKITRIFFSDAVSGRISSLADAIGSLTQRGFMHKNDTGPVVSGVRGAQHGNMFNKILTSIQEKGLIAKLSEFLPKNPVTIDGQECKDVDSLVSKLIEGNKEFPQDQKTKVIEVLKEAYLPITGEKLEVNIKQLLLDSVAYLFYGTLGSGIIQASLQTEQNEQLTSMFLAQRFSGKGTAPNAPRSTQFPFEVHPAHLNLTLFGCPVVRLAQKYFIDMGTNSTLDNFYTITKVDHNIGPGEFKTAVDMVPYDIYGRFITPYSKIVEAFTQAIVSDIAAQTKKNSKRK